MSQPTLQPEALYVQLKQLVAEMPSFDFPPSQADLAWIARLSVLVNVVFADDIFSLTSFQTASTGLGMSSLFDSNSHTVRLIAHQALAIAESRAPAAVRGGFVATQSPFDALSLVTQLFSGAQSDLLVIDPYLSQTVVADYVTQAPEHVAVRLLGDSFASKAAVLQPTIQRFGQQFKGRKFECRLTPPRALHDRLVMADKKIAWNLSQSLKDFAGRSPATAQQLDAEFAALKIQFYESLWLTSVPVV